MSGKGSDPTFAGRVGADNSYIVRHEHSPLTNIVYFSSRLRQGYDAARKLRCRDYQIAYPICPEKSSFSFLF